MVNARLTIWQLRPTSGTKYLPKFVVLSVELPLVLLSLVMPDVALVDRDDECSVNQKLGKEPAHPESLAIESGVFVADHGRVIAQEAQVQVFTKYS